VLRESEDRYRDLYENAPNAYLSVRAADGSILQCNRAATTLLGYDRETLRRMKVSDLYADSPEGLIKALEAFKRFQTGETVRDMESNRSSPLSSPRGTYDGAHPKVPRK
jgi:PAS domain S-box-containing protein